MSRRTGVRRKYNAKYCNAEGFPWPCGAGWCPPPYCPLNAVRHTGHGGSLAVLPADRLKPTANCQLPTANCQLPTANYQPPTANHQLPSPLLNPTLDLSASEPWIQLPTVESRPIWSCALGRWAIAPPAIASRVGVGLMPRDRARVGVGLRPRDRARVGVGLRPRDRARVGVGLRPREG